MHAAVSVLQKCLPDVFGAMHLYRVRGLLAAVSSLLSCRRLILMEMARAWPGTQHVRAPLKRLSRLLSNPRLWREQETFYVGMMKWLIRHREPVILIDWSDLHADCRWQLLRASIPLKGRAVTLFEMVFPESQKGSPKAEKAFLKKLHALLPAHVRPIVVTDAGFRTPWLRELDALHWSYVGRLRGSTQVQIGDQPWIANKQWHPQITLKPQRVQDAYIVRKQPWQVDMVTCRKPPQGRKRLSVRKGTRSRANSSLKAQSRESEPWILLVSATLRHLSPKRLASIYALRMQIEQSFRDLKCDRYGCAFHYSLTRDAKRIAVLLLIHALASFLAWLAAMAITQQAWVHYGGLSSKKRLYYSRVRIGWDALRRSDPRCNPGTLYHAFLHPPAEVLTWLQLPT